MDRPPVARRALENEAAGEFAPGDADAATWLCPGVAAAWHQYLLRDVLRKRHRHGAGSLLVRQWLSEMAVLRRLPPFGDFLVCGISTQLHQRVADFDEEIAAGDPEFAASGLKAASLIRLGFLAVLPDSALLGRIGSLSSTRRLRLLPAATTDRHVLSW